MICWKNFAVALAVLSLAACSNNQNCKKDPCACTDPAECAVAVNDAACDFIANAGDRVFFGFDKDNLTPEAKDTLRRQACWLGANNCRKLIIEGHCDERGTREYNMGLGQRRAQVVKDFLVENGVDASRVEIVSYGKDRPIQPENAVSKEEVWRINRVAVSVVE